MTIRVMQETKKRQNRNVKGSIVSSPIFMIGNEVPHNAPAKRVKNTALAFLLSNEWGKDVSPFLVRQSFINKRIFA